MPKLRYVKPVWPENILPDGDHADYYVERDGVRVGFVRVDRAGRSSGTITRWTAYDIDRTPVGRSCYSTLRDLRADLDETFAIDASTGAK